VDSTDKLGATPLHFASLKGYLDMVKLLIEHNANVNHLNNMKRTPLHRAAFHGHIDVIKVLLKAKADVNIMTDKKYTISCSKKEKLSRNMLYIIIY